MAKIKVIIEDMAGKKTGATIPDDVPVNRLITSLVTSLKLPAVDTRGRRLSYRLVHRESGEQLSDGDTLSQAGVLEHHTLKLLAELIAGSSTLTLSALSVV